MGKQGIERTRRGRLIQMRDALGLAQRGMAEESGMSLGAYQGIEKGADLHLSSALSISETVARLQGVNRSPHALLLELFCGEDGREAVVVGESFDVAELARAYVNARAADPQDRAAVNRTYRALEAAVKGRHDRG